MNRIGFDVNDPELRDGFLRQGMFDALAALDEASPPRWGKMTARQMLEHLVWAFECSTGRVRVECTIPPAERERMKTFLFHNRPTPHGFMNPALVAGLPLLRYASLEEAMAALRVEVHRFVEQSTYDAQLYTHPIFGPIGAAEWARTHFKHGCHHLLQFDLIRTE